ncbi:MAG: hypothetical protein JWR37_2659 [Mycobacterium sp.]|nr:hypothetical protein [Mycobacterium sp.]
MHVGAQLFAMFASMGADVDDLPVRFASLRASTLGPKNAVAGSEGRGMTGVLESIPEVALDPLIAFTWGVGNLCAPDMFGPKLIKKISTRHRAASPSGVSESSL